MAIPTIRNYDLDSTTLSVANNVPWEIDASRVLLLVHDMQDYFLTPIPHSMREKLVRNCSALISWSRENSVPVVYTGQKGDMTPEERGLLFDFWGHGMSAAPSHTKIASPLTPHPEDDVLDKWRYSAFFSSRLGDIF
ncbi:isochorismatase family protein [Microbulbifer sp. ANSA003]|uniref:isochorismatase family protein n=1 Tax=Microbulbifer sp. ANSA003 TaxID=3243360 RepID=UPI0040417994